MKHLLILGAGGYAVDIYEYAKESVGFGIEFDIKGFLDPDKDALKEFPEYPQVIAFEDEYEIQEDDVFICALGDVSIKKKCIEKLLNRGARFINLIHKTAYVAPSCQLGEGNLIQPYVRIGSGARVGFYNTIQTNTIIAHNCLIGDYNRIDCNVMCVGGISIGNGVTIHTGAVINHKVMLHNNSIVAALSFVIRSVKEGTTVIGNPAKKVSFE